MNPKIVTILLPSFSVLIFALLYFFSTKLYPGGSQAEATAQGFDWVHNYWCDLLGETATNGEPNTAQSYAIAAMFILGLGLSILCFQFPNYYPVPSPWQQLIPITGSLAMLLTTLLFTRFHDMLIGLASALGLVTLVGIFIALYQNKAAFFIKTGLFCAVLIVVNNYIYYSRQYIFSLPLLQKVTFLMVLLWLVALNFSFLEK